MRYIESVEYRKSETCLVCLALVDFVLCSYDL